MSIDNCPITGKACDKHKTIPIIDIDGNTVNLCEICGTVSLESSINLLFKNLYDAFGMKPPCPMCGSSLFEINKCGKLGCYKCYEHYKQELNAVINYVQKATIHKGKVSRSNRPIVEQIALLKLKIQELIREEKYEDIKNVQNQIDYLIKSSNLQS